MIRAFLGVIEQYENKLLAGRSKTRISDGELDKLTMTALKVKTGLAQRLIVPHDLKARFPRMSQNEFMECRKTAVAMYESYLALRKKRGRKTSRPCEVNRDRRIPRWIFYRMFKLVETPTAMTRWWLNLRNSMDSVLEKRRVHDRLHVPLKMSPYHLKQLKRGELKALQIISDRTGKWWVILAVRLVDVLKTVDTSLPPAVLGIDLGIKKAACTALITPEKVRETKYFVQKEKVRTIEKYDLLVANLQGEMDTRRKSEKPYDNVAAKLRKLKTKRENIAREYDRVLIKRLVDYISELSERYTLYVALGKLKHIRNKARRDSRKSREFRKMIHSWPFSRITNSLKYQLLQLGWPVDGIDSRFRVVPEAWTSILCWKCGSKGRRPKQSDFHCPSCGHKTNADRNGAINIAGRLITLTESLHSVRGRGKWADSVNSDKRPRLNSYQKMHSGGKSSLPHMDAISHPRESAAVRFVQSDLLSFGDETELSDDDPAVERTVKTLIVAGSDTPAIRQEKEARSVGGIPSQ